MVNLLEYGQLFSALNCLIVILLDLRWNPTPPPPTFDVAKKNNSRVNHYPENFLFFQILIQIKYVSQCQFWLMEELYIIPCLHIYLYLFIFSSYLMLMVLKCI